MLEMRVKRNVHLGQPRERSIVPMIRMRVRQEDGVDVGPLKANGLQSFLQLFGVESYVDQHPKIGGSQAGGVSTASAGQHCKYHGHD